MQIIEFDRDILAQQWKTVNLESANMNTMRYEKGKNFIGTRFWYDFKSKKIFPEVEKFMASGSIGTIFVADILATFDFNF